MMVRAAFWTRPGEYGLHSSAKGVVVRVAAVLLVVLALGAPPAFAQTSVQAAPATHAPDPASPPRPQQTPVFRSGAALVALNVTVLDNAAHYVSGLQSTDFAVYEDGVRQDVRFFQADKMPVDLIVLLDTSASMTDKMDVVHEAASGFLKTLRDGDRGAVVGFSDTVTVLQPLTNDRSALQRAIGTTQAHGGTSLHNAVYISLKQFGRAARADADVRRQAIVVLSDGEDTSSLVTFDDVLALARQMGVNVYTVALQSREAARRLADDGGRRYFTESDYAMQTLARETGAQAFFPGPAGLKSVYASIATELANQYSIGYVPANPGADGRFRKVVVQVITRPELRPRTRLGYTTSGASSPDPSPSLSGSHR